MLEEHSKDIKENPNQRALEGAIKSISKLIKIDVMIKIINRLEKNEKMFSELERAKNRFREKSAYEYYKPIQVISKVCQVILPGFSVLTGIFALTVIFNAFLPGYLSVLLAALLLSLWERIKCILLLKNYEYYYLNNALGIGLIVTSFIFASGSIYLSITGVSNLSEQLDETELIVNSEFESKKDSILTLYTRDIEGSKKAAESYFEKNSYNGVIRYAKDERYAKHYQELMEEILELKKNRNVSLKSLEKLKMARLKSGKKDYQSNTYSFLAITIIIEILIIASNWFLVFFDYRIYKEEGLIKSSIDSKINLSPDEITNVFQAYLLPKLLNEQLVAASATSNTSKIGFQSTLNKTASNQEETRNNQENGLLSAVSEKNLIYDIQAGKRDYRSLMKKYKINVLTLKNYIENYG